MEGVEIYHNEVLSISKILTEKIGQFKSSETKDELSQEIETLFGTLNESILVLDVEARNHPQEIKKTYQGKVVEHRKVASNLQNEYQRGKNNLKRNDLLDGSKVEQQRYLNANEKLNRQQITIENATRSVAETEEVGIGIMQGLDDNRNKIIGTKGKIGTLNNEVDKAGDILKSMEKRDNCTIM